VTRDRYAETVAYLQGLEAATGWDLKLERVRAALDRLGHPERALPAIHVAGTNGKGSVAAVCESVLRAAGYRTGLYTSPHLVDLVERIRAGGGTIPRATVVELVDELRIHLDGLGLTHFEFVTVLAFVWFARIGIDVAVVEVGLGGRLDATNVVPSRVSVVTPVALDHEAHLGTDLATIAAEKAGIMKPGVAVCLGPQPAAAAAVLRRTAAQVGAPLLQGGVDGRLDGDAFEGCGVRWDGLSVRLAGGFQRDNAEVALLALASVRERWPCSPAAVRAGLAGVRWPGRLAVLEGRPPVVLDGAHNPAAAAAVAAELPALLRGRPTTLVFAVMADQAWADVLSPLRALATRAIVTSVGTRAVPPETLAAALAPDLPCLVEPDARQAVRRAMAVAGADGIVLVAGSLFLVGAAYAELAAALFPTWHGWEADGTDPPR
jgi:dihydrofolate synthase/folylpolyglutamate synthase